MKHNTLGLILLVTAALGCGDCADSNGANNDRPDSGSPDASTGGDAGNNGPDGATGDANTNGDNPNLLSVTLPPEPGQFGPFTIAADNPVRIPLSFALPSGSDAGEVVALGIDLAATAEAMTIVRTDGGTSPDPTVNFRLGAVTGDDPNAACAAEPAVDVTITGNSDFSEKTATDEGSGLDGIRAADDGSNVFSACIEVTASVNIELTPAAVIDLEIEAGCNDPPQDVAGRWAGPYQCSNSCGTEEESGMVELTVLQAGETAIYFDDGGAFYFGSVCGPSFSFVGGHPTYSEWGTFTRTGETTATKTSTYESSTGDNCGGDCDDQLTLQ